MIVDIYRISAVTLIIQNMERSCNFYSQIPGFKLVYGGSFNDSFTTYRVGNEKPPTYLNLELSEDSTIHTNSNRAYNKKDFGRMIFHNHDVDKLYLYFKNNKRISNMITFENEPINAQWGERYFHIREPDGYQISFAEPLR